MLVCPTDCQSGLARVGLSGNFVWVEMMGLECDTGEDNYELYVLISCSGDINDSACNE